MIISKKGRFSICLVVPLRRIELRSLEPESRILSIKLQGQVDKDSYFCTFRHKLCDYRGLW